MEEEGSTAAAPMPVVGDATAVTMAADTMAGAGAITVGAAEVGAIQVTVGVGGSGLDLAGAGHTGIHTTTVTALGGDTPILTTIRTALLATLALITGTTILHHQIPGHNPITIPRLLRDHPQQEDLRATRPVIVGLMSRAVPFSQLTG